MPERSHLAVTNVEIVQGYRAARAAGDRAGAKKYQSLIVTQNQGLVRRLVMRFVRPQSDADAEDAMQAGSMGLLRALEDFDPERSSFSTYAAHWIRDHMQRWAGKTSPVSRPRSASMPGKVAKAAALFRTKTGREPTAADLGVTEAELVEWSEGSQYVYLDEGPTHSHPSNDTRDRKVPFELTADAAEAEHTIDRMMLETVWADAVQGLSERNIEVAEAVFWNGETTVAVAQKHGISQGFVVQICQRVEERLKRAVARASGPPSSRPRHELVQQHLERAKKYRARNV